MYSLPFLLYAQSAKGYIPHLYFKSYYYDFVLIHLYQNLLTLIFMSDETKRITEEKSEEKKFYGLDFFLKNAKSFNIIIGYSC